MRRGRVSAVALLLQAFPAAFAGELMLSGSLDGELRGFPEDPQFEQQLETWQPSLVVAPEWRYQSDDRRHRFRFSPFYRADAQDSRRSHFDLREAYYLTTRGDWEFRAGIDKVFWGVTESRHLVDIINQTDTVEDIDNEDKLGQPMLHAAYLHDLGWVGVYLMSGFRERTFPGKHGRLRFPQVTDGDARYDGNAGRGHIDFALRYATVLGDWDIGAYYFRGVGREPRFEPDAGGTRLVPVYDLIHQVGTDVQYTREAWLWKFEGIVREGQGRTFGALVAGFEYTLYQVAASDADLGLLFEYLYDGRDEDPAQAPFTLFDDDFFFGTRLGLNDIDDSQLLVGVIVDREDRSSLLFAEAETRITDRWKAEIEGRFFLHIEDDSFRAFEKDSFVNLRLSYSL